MVGLVQVPDARVLEVEQVEIGELVLLQGR
jgi:hypothetical protein